MTDKLKQIIKEELSKLPKEAQEAINSLDWSSIIEEIGKKYLLNESEINHLQAETLTVLIGLTSMDLYATHIENEIGTTKDDAEKIAAEATEKIFKPTSDVYIENIKKSGKDKNPNPEQTIDFILSGGDYSAFVEERETQVPSGSLSAGSGNGTGNHLAFSTPPQKGGEGNNTKIPMKPKMTDIKSKFTI